MIDHLSISRNKKQNAGGVEGVMLSLRRLSMMLSLRRLSMWSMEKTEQCFTFTV